MLRIFRGWRLGPRFARRMMNGSDTRVLRTRSELFRRALDLIPGGVNSPVRAMRAVGLDEPLFVGRGEGAYLEDVDGNRYLDWVMSWGPLIFGHADLETVAAVRDAADRGTSFGAPTHDVDAVASTVAEYGEGLAAIIVEPVAGNMGVVPPEPGFLEALRRLCDASGALLVFDEVITGFRVARGGAQELFDVMPDLTILGKIVGGGLPLAAFGGRAEIMDRLAPSGDVYQAGTLSGNPLATAAGLAVLRRLGDPSVYEQLEHRGARLEAGLAPSGRVQRVGAMATLFMTDAPVRNFDDAQRSDTDRYGALFRHLLDRGIYLAPSQFEGMFVSLAHGDEEIDRTIQAIADFG